jgi:hypothetical protein
MTWKPIAASAALMFVCLFSFLATRSVAQSTGDEVIAQPDGSAIYNWDPNQLIPAEDNLITSVPSTFAGTNVASIIGTNTWYSNGFTGGSSITMNVEAGHIWNGHETLGHVTSLTNAAGVPNAGYATPAFDRHATWVGMMMGGRQGGSTPGVYQEGIARNTDLRSGAIATSWSGAAYAGSFFTSSTSMAVPYTAGFGTADAINSSWGSTGGSGSTQTTGTDFNAMLIDSLANGNRFTTFVGSAGNSGSGSNSVGSPGSGYNGITVAALQNVGNVYNTIATFSSRGPQDYRSATGSAILLARAPVDIAAPGTDLTSAFYGGRSGGNDPLQSGSTLTSGSNLYSGGLAGTSFSAPITAACVSLMHGAAATLGLPADAEDTRVIKANLLNAAQKIPGWNNGQSAHPNGNGGVTTTQSLDYASGAGALDMNRTYSQYLLGQTDIPGIIGGSTAQTTGWDYATAVLATNTDVVITTPMQGGTQFRVTLDWFRDRTYINSTTQTDNGFADLNLQVWNSTFTTLYSESKSLYTEVEHLAFNLPVTGTYGLRVQYPSNVFGALASEEFGLAWSGVAVPEPSSIAVALIGLAIFGGCQRQRRSA